MKLAIKEKMMLLLLTDLLLVGSLSAVVSVQTGNPTTPNKVGGLFFAGWITIFIVTLKSSFFQKKTIGERFGTHLQLAFACSTLVGYILFLGKDFGADLQIIAMFPAGLILLGVPRVGLQRLILENIPSSEREKVLIIGNGKVGAALHRFLTMNPSHGEVIGTLPNGNGNKTSTPPLDNHEDIERLYAEKPFEKILITSGQDKSERMAPLIAFSEKHGVRVSIVLDFPSIPKGNFELQEMGGIPIMDLREIPLNEAMADFWKRAFDIIFSVTALTFLAPLFLLIAAAIKLDSKGPVFYKPLRVGRAGHKIRIYKFRSMIHQPNPDQENKSAQKNDNRVTNVGKFLRRYSLDELPQFINVLQGSMSVVGPRPHRVDLDNNFQENVLSYPIRRFIKPGITGWAQINGWRGLTKDKLDLKARTLHDLWYVEHWSFSLDLLIIFLTLFGKKSHQNAF